MAGLIANETLAISAHLCSIEPGIERSMSFFYASFDETLNPRWASTIEWVPNRPSRFVLYRSHQGYNGNDVFSP